MPPLLRPALLTFVLALAPAGARAEGFALGLRGGLAAPGAEAVQAGPSVGISAGMRLGTRYRLVLGFDQSTHSLASQRAAIVDASTGWFGIEAALDEAPIVPALALGPALQYAARRERDARAWVPTAFVDLGLRAPLRYGIVLGVHARYLTSDFSREGFPAFSSFFLEIGWAP
jgi:hypothetical protein